MMLFQYDHSVGQVIEEFGIKETSVVNKELGMLKSKKLTIQFMPLY